MRHHVVLRANQTKPTGSPEARVRNAATRRNKPSHPNPLDEQPYLLVHSDGPFGTVCNSQSASIQARKHSCILLSALPANLRLSSAVQILESIAHSNILSTTEYTAAQCSRRRPANQARDLSILFGISVSCSYHATQSFLHQRSESQPIARHHL